MYRCTISVHQYSCQRSKSYSTKTNLNVQAQVRNYKHSNTNLLTRRTHLHNQSLLLLLLLHNQANIAVVTLQTNNRYIEMCRHHLAVQQHQQHQDQLNKKMTVKVSQCGQSKLHKRMYCNK